MRNAGDDKRIIRIADKYQDKIINEFGEYVDFDNAEDIKTNVFFLTDKECDGRKYKMKKQNGKCDFNSGKIYLRESAFEKSKSLKWPDEHYDRVLIHEYIHRLARYEDDGEWFSGVQFCDGLFYTNEALTEYFTWRLTGYSNQQILYDLVLDQIIDIVNIYGLETFKQIYFQNNIELLKECLWPHFKRIVSLIYYRFFYFIKDKPDFEQSLMCENELIDIINLMKRNPR